MENQAEIGIFIGFGCLAMLTLALLIIVFFLNYRRNMLEKERRIQAIQQEKQIAVFRASVEAEERQKERIANNLHDEIIPLLIVLGQNNEKHVRDYRRNTFDPENLKADALLLGQIIGEVRSIALDLIPKVLLNFGFVKAMEQYIRQINNSNERDTEIQNRMAPGRDVPFSRNDQVNLYRSCLEIVNNLHKHAQYTYLMVSLDCDAEMFSITFRHDGKGVTNAEIDAHTESSMGLGLKSLKSRLLILNASIHYAIETDTASIHLSIPLEA